MTWWNPFSKPDDELSQVPGMNTGSEIKDPVGSHTVSSGVAGEPLAERKRQMALPNPDPEPDFSTKPDDIVGYCFGYVCPKKHVNSTFENITVDGYKERRACQTCGGVAKPAIVKRISEARWVNHDRSSHYGLSPDPDWKWRHTYFVGGYSAANMMIQWTKYEFVHYLDTPKPAARKSTVSPYDLAGAAKGGRRMTK